MTVVGVDIDSTLQLIDEVASSQEGLAAEEALILRGYVFLLGWLVRVLGGTDRLPFF